METLVAIQEQEIIETTPWHSIYYSVAEIGIGR